MPQVTYTFALPEEQQELEEFQLGTRYRTAFGELWEKVRSKKKYESDSLPEGELKAYCQVYDWIGDICSSHDIEVP